MSNVYIIHGWEGRPHEPVLKWLKDSLEEKGHTVTSPNMPNPSVPTIEEWVGKLKEVVELKEDTILVGHSVGCQAVMRYIETLPEGSVVSKIVLLAPWMTLDNKTIEEEGEEVIEIARPWIETPINFEKIKNIVGKTVAIFSDNDPYVPVSEEEFFKEKLDADTVMEIGMGHFSPSDDIAEVPSLLEAVLK
jgi:predicted alpha/beta hydrolase family esterase